MDKEVLKEWLYIADMDIDSAQLLRQMRPKHYEIICFHCQQSAEKYFKGFLYSHDIEPPKTHDLILLCNICCDIDDSFSQILNECAFLTPFGVQPRYPHELNIEEYQIAKALTFAQNIKDFSAIAELQNLAKNE